MQAMPTVSIIMPCYNAKQHLPSSVGSVLAQSLTDWELIAIDDGSGDDTLQWLRSQTDPRIHVHTQTNQGVSAARNTGLTLARGRYVAFLDADDTWSSCFLKDMTTVLDANSGNVLAYCGWQNLGLQGGRGEPFVPPDYEQVNKMELLLAACPWPIHGALTRLAAVRAAGGFDGRFANAEDYGLWLRIAVAGRLIRVPEVLAFYHHHGVAQASSNRVRAAREHWLVQHDFIKAYPGAVADVARNKLRQLIDGELLHRGFVCYWERDLEAARVIFRMVMRTGYGTWKDWVYMLPALLPAPLHKAILAMTDRRGHS